MCRAKARQTGDRSGDDEGKRVIELQLEPGEVAGVELRDDGRVGAIASESPVAEAGVSVGYGWRLFMENDPETLHKVALHAPTPDPLRLTFVRPVAEPKLGVGVPLPGCQEGVPHLFVQRPQGSSSNGTVLFLHGSSNEDWLGNGGEDGVTTGGITELAGIFLDANFTTAVLDSYTDGRKGRITTPVRVEDLLAALQYIQDNDLPKPVHVYGKSNGGYVVIMAAEFPIRSLQTDSPERREEKQRRANELLRTVSSLIVQCPFVSTQTDITRLRDAASLPDSCLPPTLFLLAEQDGMYALFNQPVDAGVKAADAIAATVVSETVEVVKTVPPRRCLVQRRLGRQPRRQRVEVRVYSDIGHTFVMDPSHKDITDGSCKPIVQHAARSAVSWCRSFAPPC